MSLIVQLISSYGKVPWSTKLFLFIRWITAPFEKLEVLVPRSGVIIDIGCGHGLFSLLLTVKSAQRTVIGIDPDREKIEVAQQLVKKHKKLSFKQGFFSAKLFPRKCTAAVINDVLYLLSSLQKEALIKEAKKALKTNGQIIIKTTPKSASLGYWLCYLQEILSVRFLQFTFTSKEKLYFLTVPEYLQLFKKCGLVVRYQAPLRTWFFHPHYVFILKTKDQS